MGVMLIYTSLVAVTMFSVIVRVCGDVDAIVVQQQKQPLTPPGLTHPPPPSQTQRAPPARYSKSDLVQTLYDQVLPVLATRHDEVAKLTTPE